MLCLCSDCYCSPYTKLLQRIYFLESYDLPACLQALLLTLRLRCLDIFVGFMLAGLFFFFPLLFELGTEWSGLLLSFAYGLDE